MTRLAARCAGDDPERGSALVEFVGVTVVVLLPLVYLLLSVFTVQRAAFGVDEGARDAGRALTLAGSTPVGMARALLAARIALDDQGVTTPPDLRVTTSGCSASLPGIVPVLTPGARFDVCLSVRVPLPFTGDRMLGRVAPAGITVTGEYVLVVPPYQGGQ